MAGNDVIDYPPSGMNENKSGGYLSSSSSSSITMMMITILFISLILPWYLSMMMLLAIIIIINAPVKNDRVAIIKGIGMTINSDIIFFKDVVNVLLQERATRMSFIYVLTIEVKDKVHVIKRPLKDLLQIRKEIHS